MTSADMLAWCNRGLKEHLEGVAKFVMLDEEYLAEARDKVKAMIDLELDVESLKREVLSTVNEIKALVGADLPDKFVAYTAYLHDVGKAIREYQERFKMAGRNCRVSLAGHEFWSSYIAYYALRGFFDEQLATDGAVAVALHHSSKRYFDDVVYNALKVNTTPDDISTMFQLAEEGLRVVGLQPGSEFERFVAVGKYAYKTYGLARARERLLFARSGVVELLSYLIALADNFDYALSDMGIIDVVVFKRFLRP
ncbi:MAG: CRISPR-associated endonuclease Cas3'' [Conexivisphaerales archaeon]